MKVGDALAEVGWFLARMLLLLLSIKRPSRCSYSKFIIASRRCRDT